MKHNEIIEAITKAGKNNVRIEPDDNGLYKIEAKIGGVYQQLVGSLHKSIAEEIVKTGTNRVICG